MHRLQLLLGKIDLWQILRVVTVIIDHFLKNCTCLAIFFLCHMSGGDVHQRVDRLVTLGILLLNFLEDLDRFIIILFVKELLACRV